MLSSTSQTFMLPSYQMGTEDGLEKEINQNGVDI
jgi:hypothetical protein